MMILKYKAHIIFFDTACKFWTYSPLYSATILDTNVKTIAPWSKLIHYYNSHLIIQYYCCNTLTWSVCDLSLQHNYSNIVKKLECLAVPCTPPWLPSWIYQARKQHFMEFTYHQDLYPFNTILNYNSTCCCFLVMYKMQKLETRSHQQTNLQSLQL